VKVSALGNEPVTNQDNVGLCRGGCTDERRWVGLHVTQLPDDARPGASPATLPSLQGARLRCSPTHDKQARQSSRVTSGAAVRWPLRLSRADCLWLSICTHCIVSILHVAQTGLSARMLETHSDADGAADRLAPE
jgi:hypothetical protein